MYQVKTGHYPQAALWPGARVMRGLVYVSCTYVLPVNHYKLQHSTKAKWATSDWQPVAVLCVALCSVSAP